ncbi:hypothetical protein Q4519_09175 [Motilimonas sp. 1_MG-2023]|uniref:hypothetical protein n=1 Tax=Motilimonas sp. 1_MG-2023 TaxID=3062672 RepID=UPI0026E35395|nr:hypothetical protein [Motilimonas sp. 1_MG-2023]MDO6525847.1 hypothetical protein [Motilimonas sp. 1_MG-2023]
MNRKKEMQANIAISILFAVVMLVSSYVIADKDLTQNIVIILIAIWFVPFLYLSKISNRIEKPQS